MDWTWPIRVMAETRGPLSPTLARNPLSPVGCKVRPPWIRHTPTHPRDA